jgi:uncharacterized membrane protein YfhO
MAARLGTTDLHRAALIEHPLPIPPEPAKGNLSEKVRFIRYEANRMTIEVQAESRALLVLSELFDTGWRASINGRSAEIARVDRGLRGLSVPAGRSEVVLHYASAPLIAGSVVSGLWWAGSLGLALFNWRRSRLASPRSDDLAPES